MVSKFTKKPEKSRTGMAVTGPTNVATWDGKTGLLNPYEHGLKQISMTLNE